MKFNFRKISSVLGSAAMMGSTFALAAAANYPAPFVSAGNSDVAIVYGSSAGPTDIAAATGIGTDLSATLASQSVSVGGTVTTEGETAALFGSDKLYNGDALNKVKTSLTETQLPSVLKDQSFSGNVEAKETFKITLGSNPTVSFAKMPSSSDDPKFGLAVGTNGQTQYIYNATVTFNKAVNLTHSDSEGQELILFGQKYTIASDTDGTDLVLLQSATKINLDSNSPTQDVTVGGKKYTVTLVSASDSSATIMVTDENGNSDQKEIDEAASKKVQGLTIAVTSADENNLKYSAAIVAGSEKVTLTSGSQVTYGEEDTAIDGTYVYFNTDPSTLTSITVGVAAANTDEDAIFPGSSFVDPVFKNFKIDFAGMNIADSSDDRETLEVTNSGDDKMLVKFKDYNGNEKSGGVQFAKNLTSGTYLQYDDSGHNITVVEKGTMYKNDYAVLGNEDEGVLVKLTTVTNQSTSYNNDKIVLTNVLSGSTYTSTMDSEGAGTVQVEGNDYTFTMVGDSTNSDTTRVVFNYPDSTGNSVILFPTIETSKGAKLAFVAPTEINFTATGVDGANIKVPSGDGYTDLAVASAGNFNYTIGGSLQLNLSAANGLSSVTKNIGNWTYNFTSSGKANVSKVYLMNTAGTANLADPALLLIEEKDDNDAYKALIVKLETGGTSDNGIGVSDVERTQNGDAAASEYTLASDSDITKEADFWGTIVTTDASDSDQKSAMISYPGEQVYAQIYVSAVDATVSAGGSSSIVPVKDNEVSGVSTKNLIVVGGSCINTVAAKLLGSDSPVCGADFTTKTGVGSGEYLIKTYSSPYSTGKVATLVAGYEAADTTNAFNSLKTNKPEIAAGKGFKGTTASTLSAM